MNWLPINSPNNVTHQETFIKIYKPKTKLEITEALATPSTKTGKGIVRSDIKFIDTFLQGAEVKDIQLWKKFRRAYLGVPLVAAGIDVTADNTITSFHLVGGSDKNKEEINKLLKLFNLNLFFHNVCKQMLIYGNAFIESVKGKDGIEDLKILDPIIMFVNRNKYGNFDKEQKDAYLQFIPMEPTEPIKFTVDEILHYKLNQLGESAYGHSILEPLLGTIQLKINVEANMDVIIDRYAAPLLHFKVGTPERPASQSEINSLSTDLEDIQADSELVTDDRVAGVVLGSKDKALNLQPFLTYLDQQIAGGLETPLVFLGKGDIDRAAAEVQLDMFDRRGKGIQQVIARTTEVGIFRPHLEAKFGVVEEKDIPQLVWGEPEQRQDREDINTIISLTSAGILTPQKANSLLPEEFQEKLPEKVDPMSQDQDEPLPKIGNNQKSPSLDRIRTARDKRDPKAQKRGEE